MNKVYVCVYIYIYIVIQKTNEKVRMSSSYIVALSLSLSTFRCWTTLLTYSNGNIKKAKKETDLIWTFCSLTHRMHKHYSVYQMNCRDKQNMEYCIIYDLNLKQTKAQNLLRSLCSVNTHFHSWFQISFQIMSYVIEWLSTKSCICSLFLSLSLCLSRFLFSAFTYYYIILQ